MNKKYLFYVLTFIIIFNVAHAFIIDEFTNGLTEENFTYIGGETNYTRYLRVPLTANISDATLILYPFNFSVEQFIIHEIYPQNGSVSLRTNDNTVTYRNQAVNWTSIVARGSGLNNFVYSNITSNGTIILEADRGIIGLTDPYDPHLEILSGLHMAGIYTNNAYEVNLTNESNIFIENIHINITGLPDTARSDAYGMFMIEYINNTNKVFYRSIVAPLFHRANADIYNTTHGFINDRTNVTFATSIEPLNTTLNFAGDLRYNLSKLCKEDNISWDNIRENTNKINLSAFVLFDTIGGGPTTTTLRMTFDSYLVNSTKESYNVGLSLGDTKTYSDKLKHNEITKVNLTSDIKNVYNPCDCTECTISSGYCTFPITFTSSGKGIIEVSEINITYTNNMTFLIYDEETNNLITTETINVDLIGVTESFNVSVENGNLTLDLNEEQYFIRYYGTTYGLRTQFLDYTHGTERPIKLYLVKNTTETQDITLVVINQFENRVQGANIIVYKKIGTNFEEMVNIQTNINGEAEVTLIPETELYRYEVYNEGVLLWNLSSNYGEPVYPPDTEYTFQVYIGDDIFGLEDILRDIISGLYFVPLENTTAANYTFSYIASEAQTVCLKITNQTHNDIFYDECITGTAGGFIVNLNVTESTTFHAVGLLEYEGTRYLIRQSTNRIGIETPSPYSQQSEGYEGFIIGLIVIIAASLLFTRYPELVMISTGLAFIILVHAELFYLPDKYRLPVEIGIFFLTVIITGLVYQGGKK